MSERLLARSDSALVNWILLSGELAAVALVNDASGSSNSTAAWHASRQVPTIALDGNQDACPRHAASSSVSLQFARGSGSRPITVRQPRTSLSAEMAPDVNPSWITAFCVCMNSGADPECQPVCVLTDKCRP